MEVSGLLKQVLFIVVRYRQPLHQSRAFNSLKPLMQKYPGTVSLFVYDNSDEASNELEGTTYYLHDKKNSGVSRAYNTGFTYAKSNGFRFLILMDQDSFFPENIFDSYSQAVVQHPEVEVFAPRVKDQRKLYSPFRFRRGKGSPLHSLKPGLHRLTDTKLVNSGLLVSVNAFEKCGGYDERFPLDFSDIVFCDRLLANNFNVCLLDGFIDHEHSSSHVSPSNESKERFEQYLKALALYKRTNTKVSYWRSAFPRAAKLSFQLRDRWFLQRLFALRA